LRAFGKLMSDQRKRDRMIENIPIKDLTLLTGNPRTISKEQMKKLCDSIEEDRDFLQKRPVLVNRIDNKNVVYAGNQRVRAAKILKIKEIPCIIDHDLADEVMRKRIILDNKTYGEFDFDILGNEYDIDMLVSAGFSFDELTGFGIDEQEEGEKPKKKDKLKMCPHCKGVL